MTSGDMGWGTPEQRAEEGRKAGEILKLDVRECLDMGDCRVEDTFREPRQDREHDPPSPAADRAGAVLRPAHRARARAQRPLQDRQIVSNAFNLAHLAKAPCEGEPFQAKAMFYFFIPPGTRPTFVVDITPYVDDWLAALDCHQTQFYHPDRPRPAHMPHPREAFESYARYWGWQIGVKHAAGVPRHLAAQDRGPVHPDRNGDATA